MRGLAVVAVVLVVAAAAREQPSSGTRAGAGRRRDVTSRVAPGTSAASWLDLLAAYARDGAAAEWVRPVPVELPVGADGARTTLLLLPVPVPGPGLAQCDADRDRPPPRRTHDPEPQRDPPRDPHRPRPELDGDLPRDEDVAPFPNAAVSSARLLHLFRSWAPDAPHLPPAVIGDVSAAAGNRSAGDGGGGGPDRTYLPQEARAAPPPPPRPNFDRSLKLRGRLTVPRADYTETYTAYWDAASGSSRVEHHDTDEGTTTLRRLMADGSVTRLEVRTDRTGERAVRRCGTATGRAAAERDRAPPALPDLADFTFAGYSGSGERWTRTVRGGAGAREGEQLVYRHEMLLRRDGQFVVPLRYSVSVDSSVLGTDCDGYVHQYEAVEAAHQDPALFALDPEAACEELETLDADDAEHAARLDPLREFTLPTRDPRHDAALQTFKVEFERSYADDTEEAIRKNLFVQHRRFVSSCNRQGATFETEVNFLGDRLDAELELLLGTTFEEGFAGDGRQPRAFPYDAAGLRALRGRLPKAFDWRPRGAVSDVRYQGSCSSCWAFAVVGSVEGALFVRTGRLVPLAEQCLVDCAHSHGAHGCGGTWPVHAYAYARDRGLPARARYTPYAERVLPCRARDVPAVTRISGHVDVPPDDVDALKAAIKRHAPSVVIIDAKPKSFMFYKKGVLRDERCLKKPVKKLNHAVVAVGWGEQRGEPHFILKNTYSARWGEAGYVRVHAPSNTCGHLGLPSYAHLERADVLDQELAGGKPALDSGEDEVLAGDVDEDAS